MESKYSKATALVSEYQSILKSIKSVKGIVHILRNHISGLIEEISWHDCVRVCFHSRPFMAARNSFFG